MESGPNLRRPNATNVFVMLLGAALVLGTLLFFLVLRPAGSGPVFTVSEVSGTTCPSGEGAPACFQLTVRNTGTESANVRCEVAAAAGTTAAFLSGGPVYTSAAAIEPEVPLPLYIKVDVTDGGDTVYAPNVSCGPA
jgi:hypothetical protein